MQMLSTAARWFFKCPPLPSRSIHSTNSVENVIAQCFFLIWTLSALVLWKAWFLSHSRRNSSMDRWWCQLLHCLWYVACLSSCDLSRPHKLADRKFFVTAKHRNPCRPLDASVYTKPVPVTSSPPHTILASLVVAHRVRFRLFIDGPPPTP